MGSSTTAKIVSGKFKSLLTEKFVTPNNRLFQASKWYGDSNICIIFKGSCLKQEKANFSPSSEIIFFIVYDLDTWSRDSNTFFTLKDYLFGGAKLTINTDLDKYVYSSYVIGFRFL